MTNPPTVQNEDQQSAVIDVMGYINWDSTSPSVEAQLESPAVSEYLSLVGLAYAKNSYQETPNDGFAAAEFITCTGQTYVGFGTSDLNFFHNGDYPEATRAADHQIFNGVSPAALTDALGYVQRIAANLTGSLFLDGFSLGGIEAESVASDFSEPHLIVGGLNVAGTGVPGLVNGTGSGSNFYNFIDNDDPVGNYSTDTPSDLTVVLAENTGFTNQMAHYGTSYYEGDGELLTKATASYEDGRTPAAYIIAAEAAEAVHNLQNYANKFDDTYLDDLPSQGASDSAIASELAIEFNTDAGPFGPSGFSPYNQNPPLVGPASTPFYDVNGYDQNGYDSNGYDIFGRDSSGQLNPIIKFGGISETNTDQMSPSLAEQVTVNPDGSAVATYHDYSAGAETPVTTYYLNSSGDVTQVVVGYSDGTTSTFTTPTIQSGGSFSIQVFGNGNVSQTYVPAATSGGVGGLQVLTYNNVGQVTSGQSSQTTSDGGTIVSSNNYNDGESEGQTVTGYDSSANATNLTGGDDSGGAATQQSVQDNMIGGILQADVQNLWDGAALQGGDTGDGPWSNPDVGPFANPMANGGVGDSDADMADGEADPLVIDMSGLGIHLEARSAFTPYFNFSGGNFAQSTAWIGSGTGFLAFLGSDGTVDNGSDLITSFAQLAAIGGSTDGVINASDPGFNNIVIWQDVNNDGVAEPDEVETLAQAGVVSISLTSTPVDESLDGCTITETAVATMVDGSTREFASVTFDTSSTYTEYAGSYTLNPTIEALPNLAGYGTLPNLQIAMSGDPTLETLVQTLVGADPSDTASFDAALQNVLYEWAGVSSVSPSSGDLFDGQKLGFLRAYLGSTSGFGLGQNSPTPWFAGQSNLLQQAWEAEFSALKADILVQLPGSVFANDFEWNANSDLILPVDSVTNGASFSTALASSIDDLATRAPTDISGQVSFWTNALLIINESVKDISQYTSVDTSTVEAALSSVVPSYVSSQVVDAAARGQLNLVEGSELNNALVGTSGSDFAILTQPNSTFTGFGGNDEILVNDGLGNVEINEVDNSMSPNNVLLLGAGVTSSMVTVTADQEGDAILTLSDGNTIKIDNEFAGPQSGGEQTAGHASITYGPDTNYGVQEVEFANGTTWSAQQLLSTELASVSTGNDILIGGPAPETFDGKGGDDYEQGGGNRDTFVFNSGYEHLEINETASSPAANNVLELGSGIDPSQVVVSGDSNGDIILTIGTGGDQVTIDKMLDQTVGGQQYGVQAVEFADGTVWTAPMVLAKQAENTNYTERLTGTSGSDVFGAVSGNIYEQGVGGGDTFNFVAGDGQLEINEADFLTSASNTLVLGSGITPSDITITGDKAGDIILADGASGDRITLDNMLDGSAYGVQTIQFANGTTWDRAEILALEMTGTTGNDQLYGTTGADVFDGKGGNDYEQGNGGRDTFVFNQGYGQLEINEVDESPDADNVIQLGAAITESDITGTSDNAGDVILTIGTNGDQIKIDGMLNSTADGVQGIDFADGTTWDRAQILALATTGTPGNDRLYGTGGPDIFDGKGGGDYEHGNGGGDTFLFNAGYGQLEISEVDPSADPDNMLQLGAGITESEVAITTDSEGDVLLTIGTNGDQIKIDSMLNSEHDGVQQVDFADGTSWGRAQVLALATTGTTGNDRLYGTTGADVFDGKGGDDYEQGNGGGDTFIYNPGYGQLEINEIDYSPDADNVLQIGAGMSASQVSVSSDSSGDIILTDGTTGDKIMLDDMLNGSVYNGGTGAQYGVEDIDFADGTVLTAMQVFNMATTGTTGNDRLYGTAGPDAFDGKGGDDYEQGNGGNDSFVFNASYGHLEIDEYNSSTGANAVLQLGAGINPSDITVTADGYGDLLLTDGITGDQVKLDYELNSANYGVQTIKFASGTTWNRQDLVNLEMTGTTGNSSLYGTPGNDVLDGKGGNDYEQGNGGNDTYIFNAGYGQLEISQYNSSASADSVLQLGAGINPSDVAVTVDGYGDFILTDSATGDQIKLDYELDSSAYGVQGIEFANGTVWTRQNLIDDGITGTSGNDHLYGTSGNDVFDGKGGNDYEQGNGGNDTFIFNAGDGHLEINQYNASSSANNVLELGPGIDPTDIAVTADGYGDLFLTDGTSGDQVEIDYALDSATYGVQTVAFANGTTLNRLDLIDLARTGTTGNDHLYGTSGSDVFDGKGGDDYEQGNGGNDTFIFKAGYGQLEINESGSSSSVLELGAGIDPSNVTVTADGYGDLFLADGVGGDKITLDYELSSTTYGVQTVEFANGTTLNRQELINLELTGTAGNDHLYGTSGNDVFDGKGGNDYEQGNGGNDAFIYNAGYGQLEINESGSSASVLELGSGIGPSDMSVSVDGYGDIILGDGISGDQIKLDTEYSSSNYGVQTIEFANGTTWNRISLLGALGDTFNLGGGGGQSTFNVSGAAIGSKPLVLGAGIDAADVLLEADSEGDLTVLLKDSGASITFENDLSATWWGQVSSIVSQIYLADGSTISVGEPSYGAGEPLTFTWVGTSANTNLTGSNFGSNVFNLGPGNDTVTGGSGNNSFEYSSGIGQASISISGGSGIANELDFGASITDEDLWLTQDGNNLEIGVLGTTSEITINNWFSSANDQLREVTADGLKLDSQLSQLVAAMATYSTNNSGFNPTTATQMPTDSTLQSAIAAAWHN